METLLCMLVKDQAAAKNKPIKEACTTAVELLENDEKVKEGTKTEIRATSLAPLQIALESKNSKLCGYAIDGLKKLVSDERFYSSAQEEDYEEQLTAQVLKCLSCSYQLPDDVMIAIMKFLLNFFNSEAFLITEKSMCSVIELCLSVQKTSLLSGTRTAIRGALLQMITSICYQLHDKKNSCAATIKSQQNHNTATNNSVNNLKQPQSQSETSHDTGSKSSSQDDINEDDLESQETNPFYAELESPHFFHSQQKGMNLLRHDVIATLKFLVSKVETFQEQASSGNALLNSQKLELCLDSLLTGLRCLPTSINCSPQFLEFVWQNLCPTLIAILGNPRNLKTVTNTHEGSEQSGAGGSGKGSGSVNSSSGIMTVPTGSASFEIGRGSGVSNSPPSMIGPNARNIYAIAGELLRLVGCLSSMRPVLQSLFHRILLFPPPNYRLEALRAVNEYLQSPMRVLDICGPTIQDTRVNENRARRDYDTDLLKLVMDGICESVYSCNSHVSSEAVGCIVSFLSTLAKISSGVGFQQYQIDEIISRWADNLELMSPDELSVKTKKFVRFSKELVQKRTFNTNSRADEDYFRQEFGQTYWDNCATIDEEIIGIEQIDRPYSSSQSSSINNRGAANVPHNLAGGGGNRKQPQSLSSGGGEGAGESEEGYEDVDISDALKNGSTEDIGIGDGVNHERSSPESIVLPPAPAIGCLKSDEDRSLGEEMRGSLGLSHSQGSVGGSVTSLAVTSAAVTGGAGEAPATDFSHLVDSADEDGDDDEAAHSNIHDSESVRSGSCEELRSLGTTSDDADDHEETLTHNQNNFVTDEDEDNVFIEPIQPGNPRDVISVEVNEADHFIKESRDIRNLDEDLEAAEVVPIVDAGNNRVIQHSPLEFAESIGSVTRGSPALDGFSAHQFNYDSFGSAEPDNKVNDDRAAKMFDITDDPEQGVKLTKTLPDIESERQALERRVEVERLAQEKVEEERQCANDYVQHLISELPSLLRVTERIEVDHLLLKFASDFCAEVAEQQKQSKSSYLLRGPNESLERSDSSNSNSSNNSMLILNADGVYIATYYTLLLNLKLIGSRYYENNGGRLPLTQKQFIEEVHESGVLVYLSSTWLSELYKLIISCNILGEGGYTTQDPRVNNALIMMLTDIDGMGNLELGGMMLHMSDKTNASLKKRIQNEHSQALNAGLKFSRRILLAVWDTILDVLAQPLRSKTMSGVTSIAMLIVEGTKEITQRDREAICLSLDGLRSAAQLSCSLGVPSLCSSVFLLITNASCAIEYTTHSDPYHYSSKSKDRKVRHDILLRKISTDSGGASNPATPGLPLKLHASHVLSMEALLSVGLEIGSHCHDCWKFIFKCSAYIAQLERACFSSGAVQSFSSTFGKTKPSASTTNANTATSLQQMNDVHNHSFDSTDHGDLSFDISQLSSSSAAGGPQGVQTESSVVEIVTQARVEIGLERSNLIGGGTLNPTNAARVVCCLSAEVDKLFEDAAVHLNLQALLQFLKELRLASQLQLFSKLSSADDCGIAIPTMSSRSILTSGKSCTALHLFRMGEIILKCIRTKRPILHVMRAWSIVAPHFVEASCHRDIEVSKKAVSSIHNILTEILNNCPEHSHFNFHEALFKPFESMLRLELCDEDIQDQVICSICELVEACQENIKSGWRPLFGSLRAVRVQKHSNDESQLQMQERMDAKVSPVFDVFDAFLGTDNVYVFANAAIDCILCLLKFVKGSGDFDPFEDDAASDQDSTVTGDANNGQQSAELCLPALERLLYCSNILSSIYKMPLKPMFRGSRSVKLTSRLAVEAGASSGNSKEVQSSERKASNEPGVDRNSGVNDDTTAEDSGGGIRCSQTVNVVYGVFMPSDLEQMDDETGKRSTGIVRVWYLLLEGLTGAVTTCPKEYQPQTLGLLFELLKAAAAVPGPEFAVFAVTHLLLPMLHSWLRRGSCVRGFWETAVANFRHATGLSTDLVVDHINHFVHDKIPLTHVPLMLTQLLDLLVECIGQPNESVARLGCSCIKHLLVSAGPNFTEQMWTISCNGLRQAVNISLCFAKKLMEHFHPGSIDFNGDIGVVKVAARRDCSEMECLRLQQLAKQVFLLDSQYVNAMANDDNAKLEPDVDETRSFIFIIYPPTTNSASNNQSSDSKQASKSTTNQNQSPQSTLRVPFRNIVVGLVSHQLLLQTLGLLLLSGSKSEATETEQNLLPIEEASQISGSRARSDEAGDESSSLPVFLDNLNKKQVNILLECLLDSYKMAADFDVRPGLKFLIQKVAKIDVAANLYRQVGASFTFYMHVLTEMCIRSADKLPQNFIKATLKLEPLLNYLPATATTPPFYQCSHNNHPVESRRSVSEVSSEYSSTTPDLLSPVLSLNHTQEDGSSNFNLINSTSAGRSAVAVSGAGKSPQENRQDMMDRLKRLQASSGSGHQPAPELSFAPPEEIEEGPLGGALTSSDSKSSVNSIGASGTAGGQCVGVSSGMEWIVKRMYAMCAEICAIYVQMHLDKQGDMDLERISSQPLFLLIPDETNVPKTKKSSLFRDFGLSSGEIVPIEEDEPLEIRAPNKRESMEWGTTPLGLQHPGTSSSTSALNGAYNSVTALNHGSAGDFYEDSTKMYTVATNRTIKNLMKEYKKRKVQHSRSVFVRKPFQEMKDPVYDPNKSPDDNYQQMEISQQQKSSIIKDSDAKIQAWTEMITGMIQLIQFPNDALFKDLLPVTFPVINQLMCHVTNPLVRQAVFDYMNRISRIYNFV
ncbi:brefeldin A-inhibited guanine nucleotide-exchange protein 3-like isoform X3 [Convolutriloba macropyga]|uniref:brefeldin A-inhibited guanine nucleotide-exchange protein 3-like isoform X3 n=1 Tax=Convolutriloba macropyga TaxID=536237 RepID=UPI003F51BD16